MALRLLAGSLTSAETTCVTHAIADILGERPAVHAFSSPRRRALLIEGEEHEWLLSTVMAALDEVATEPYPIAPPLISSCPPLADEPADEHAMAAVEAAADEMISTYALRQPMHTTTTTTTTTTITTTDWDHTQAVPVVNAQIDGASFDWGWDASSVLALDNVVDDKLRASLMSLLAGDDFASDAAKGADPAFFLDGAFKDTLSNSAVGAGLGLIPERVEELCMEPPDGPTPPPILELQARLSMLLQEANRDTGGVDVCRMPPACLGDDVTPLAANAPLASDGNECYSWHIDADPALLPPSPWTDCFGRYPNRQPGKPRFVSALVYLNEEWKWPEWGAPTRFLDPPTGEVLEIPPAPGRLLLLDQDISHSVTAPLAAAGDRPRYSLVLKCVVHPRKAGAEVAIADAAWGEPQRIGSAVEPE